MDIIEKTQRINNLLDIYGELLTDKQQEIMELYFLDDLSLSEIAQKQNTTRAAVFDLIKRVTKTLEKYEAKLQLLLKRTEILKVIENLDESIKSEIIKNL